MHHRMQAYSAALKNAKEVSNITSEEEEAVVSRWSELEKRSNSIPWSDAIHMLRQVRIWSFAPLDHLHEAWYKTYKVAHESIKLPWRFSAYFDCDAAPHLYNFTSSLPERGSSGRPHVVIQVHTQNFDAIVNSTLFSDGPQGYTMVPINDFATVLPKMYATYVHHSTAAYMYTGLAFYIRLFPTILDDPDNADIMFSFSPPYDSARR